MHTTRLAEDDEMTMPQERDDEREREARAPGPSAADASGTRPADVSYSTRSPRRRAWHTVPALVLLLVILAAVATLLVLELR